MVAAHPALRSRSRLLHGHVARATRTQVRALAFILDEFFAEAPARATALVFCAHREEAGMVAASRTALWSRTPGRKTPGRESAETCVDGQRLEK